MRLLDTRGAAIDVKHLANAEQASRWDGDEGDHWTEQEVHYEASIHDYSAWLWKGAGIAPGERVLDIGCGCGESTRAAARRSGSGRVLGVDLSARMISRAREQSRLEGLTNTEFDQADAQTHDFAAHSFDVVISRFGAMFFADPVAAFKNIRRSLRPGGRLALLAWRDLSRNEWVSSIRDALAAGRRRPDPHPGSPGPFGLSDEGTVCNVLTQAGFRDAHLDEATEPVKLGTDSDDAFEFVRGMGVTRGLLDGLEPSTATVALRRLRAVLHEHHTSDGVLFDSSAWLITAVNA